MTSQIYGMGDGSERIMGEKVTASWDELWITCRLQILRRMLGSKSDICFAQALDPRH